MGGQVGQGWVGGVVSMGCGPVSRGVRGVAWVSAGEWRGWQGVIVICGRYRVGLCIVAVFP